MSGLVNLQKVCIFYRHLARLFFVVLNNVFLMIYYFVNLQTALISRFLQNKPIRERVRISKKKKNRSGKPEWSVHFENLLAWSCTGWKVKTMVDRTKLWTKICGRKSMNDVIINIRLQWFVLFDFNLLYCLNIVNLTIQCLTCENYYLSTCSVISKL